MKSSRFLALAPLQIAQALVGFGAIAAFTRLMSAEEFGRYALALSLSMAAHTALFTWAEAAAFRFFSLAQAGRRLADHFATLTAIALLFGLIAFLATSLIARGIGLGDDAQVLAAFVAGAASLRFITRIARESDRAALDFTRYAVSETAYLLLGFGAGVGFLMVTDLGAAAPFAGLALGGAIVALVDLPRLLKKSEGGLVTFSRARQFGMYGAPLALALLADLGVQAAARVILAAQSGDAAIGAYAAAFGLARPLDLMFMSISAAFAPLVFAAYEKDGHDAARDVARRAFTILAAIALPACAGLVLVAEPLANLMVGPALAAQAGQTLPLLAVAGLFSGFTLYYWSEAFQLTQRTGTRALLMLAPGAVQLGLTFWLAREYGAAGAALAALAGAGVGSVLLGVVGRRMFALPLPTAALARTLAATALMAAGLAAMATPANAMELAAYVGVGGALYAIGALAFNVMDARARASAVLQSIAVKVRALRPRPSMDSQ